MKPNLSKIQLFSASKSPSSHTVLYLLCGLAAGLFAPLNYLWLIIIAEGIFSLLFLFSCVADIADFIISKRYYNLLLSYPALTTYELALKYTLVNYNVKETEEELKDLAKDEEDNIRKFIIKCEKKGYLLPGVYFDLEAGRLVFPGQQQAPSDWNGVESSPLPANAPDAQNTGVIYCEQCGAKNPSINKFCSRCGSILNK